MPSRDQNPTFQPLRIRAVLLWTLWLLTACSSLSLVNGQATRRPDRPSRCKDRQTYRVPVADLAAQPLTFQCPQGPVVAMKDVGVKGRCKGSSPDLRLIGERCTWNNTCSVQYTGRPMDTVVEARGGNTCLGQTPDHLEISYTCLKNNVEVYDVMGTFQSTHKPEGIARSHRLFPWTYRNGNRLGNLTIARPNRPDLVNLWFTVHSLGILDSDLVFLSWDGNSTRQQRVDALRVISHNDTTFQLANIRSVILTFYADYNVHHSSLRGKENGFVICFQWLKANRRPNRDSACHKVMRPGQCQEGGRRGSSGGRTTPPSSRTTTRRNPPRG